MDEHNSTIKLRKGESMKTVIDLVAKIKEKFTMRKDIAPVEESSTASRAYSAGDKFYYGNLLQKAITDIAQGASLVGGTNFENADPVTTTIQNLSNQVSSLELTNAVNIIPFDCVSRDIYTVHSDGSVDMVNSSAGSGETRLYYIDTTESQFSFIKGKRYKLKVFGTFPSNCTFNINFWNGTDFVDSIWTAGDVKSFEWKSTYKGLRIVIIAQKSVVMNTTLKPMIVPEDFPITEWLPVAQGNAILTQNVNGLETNTTQSGCVNHLPLDLVSIKSLNRGLSWSGNVGTKSSGGNTITFTVNSNNIVVNGTAPETLYFTITSGQTLPKGSYKRVGCPSGGAFQTYCIAGSSYVDDGNGVQFTLSQDTAIDTVILIRQGVTVSNKEFRPMIIDDVPYINYETGYIPYAKSNRELTEDVVNDLKIEGISSTFFTKASDAFAVHDPHVFKQGRHIFGSFTISKTSAFGTSQVTIGTLKYAPAASVNSFCALADNRYNAPTKLGYLWLNTGANGENGPVYIKDADGTNTYAKINLDYVTV